MTTSLDSAPPSIRGWFAADTAADPAAAMRAVLAADAVFDFGGRKIEGADTIVSVLGVMMPPGWLKEVVWTLRPVAPDGRVTVRGTGPGGAPLPTPGGPIDIIDFVFTLGTDGLIALVNPQPQNAERRKSLAEPLRPGDAAPDFVLPDVAGVKVPLHQAGAKATVVVFTCNHCPYARGWHDRVQQVARDYAARGVRILQINANDPAVVPDDGVERSRQRVAAGAFAGPYLIDADQTVARRWGAQTTPEVFVLDAQGVVAYHGAVDADVGDESLGANWLRGALDQTLAGAVPSPASTPVVGCTIKWTRS